MILEQSGDLNTLQRFRYRIYSDAKRASLPPIKHLLDTELDLRHYTQLKLDIEEDNDGSNETKTFLKETNKMIWKFTREWWGCRCRFGEGVISRAFDLWRSYPTWYMHEVLVEDCIKKQGCCSRGCGCCPNRQLLGSAYQLAARHYALTCGCCQKARKFSLTEEEANEIYDKLDFKQQKDSRFSDQFQLASIWGLRFDSDQSLSDLIKLGCEKAGKNGADDPENWNIDSSTTEALEDFDHIERLMT